MTYTPRLYPDIVRDLMTTLTGGTVREPVIVPAGDGQIVLDRLADRPIRRISHLEGSILAPTDSDPERTLPYRFTATDFELVDTDGDGDADAVSFRDGGQRPAPGSTVTVNYYPVQTPPVPLTDLNVGSVVRTLLETVGRELATIETQLDFVYDSAFLDTAEATSLDRVVALVGVQRLPKGHPLVKVRFARGSGSTGRVAIPTGTIVTDADNNRYRTLVPLVLEPGEPSREALCGGVAAGTAEVAALAIDRLEVLVAGVATVSNEAPAYRATAAETDDDLRRRARGALQTTGRGTVDAIRFGVISIPGVKDVAVTEEPNGVPGEIRIDVAYDQEPDPDLLADVAARIDDLRPAGIRSLLGEAARTTVSATIQLTLAGTGVPQADLAGLTDGVETRIADHIRGLSPGDSIRSAQLVALALAESRVVDAAITLSADGGPGETSFTLAPGTVAEVIVPFAFPTPSTEKQPGPAPASTSSVDALMPLHLLAGVTEADAEAALRVATTAYLAGVRSDAPLTVDGLIAAVRDDTRYVIVRDEALVTIEAAGRFLQITDAVGTYPPNGTERLELRTLGLDVREGGA